MGHTDTWVVRADGWWKRSHSSKSRWTKVNKGVTDWHRQNSLLGCGPQGLGLDPPGLKCYSSSVWHLWFFSMGGLNQWLSILPLRSFWWRRSRLTKMSCLLWWTANQLHCHCRTMKFIVRCFVTDQPTLWQQSQKTWKMGKLETHGINNEEVTVNMLCLSKCHFMYTEQTVRTSMGLAWIQPFSEGGVVNLLDSFILLSPSCWPIIHISQPSHFSWFSPIFQSPLLINTLVQHFVAARSHFKLDTLFSLFMTFME